MLQYVNSVLVGKAQSVVSGYDGSDELTTPGSIVMVDEFGATIATEAAAAAAKKIRLGLVSDKTLAYTNPSDNTVSNINLVQYSNYITPDSIVSYKAFSYSAPTEDKIVISADSSTITAGYRYVLRLIYRDLYEHPGQFTHTYEYIAHTGDTVESVLNSFATIINKDTRRRCVAVAGTKAGATIGGIAFKAVHAGAANNAITIQFAAATTASAITVTDKAILITPKTGELALTNIQALIAGSAAASALITAVSGTASGSTVAATNLTGGSLDLTLTALAKDDNEGKESINIYTRVNMNAVMWYTNPNAAGFASKNKYPIESLVIAKTAGSNGLGYWKQIRDKEQVALSYRGILNRTWFPVIKPELNVEVNGTYDGCVIEFEPEHANAEDSFGKTKQSVEVYFKNTVAFATSMIGKMIAAFYNRRTA